MPPPLSTVALVESNVHNGVSRGRQNKNSSSGRNNVSSSPTIREQIVGKYALGKVLAAGDFDCRTRMCRHVITDTSYVVRIYDKNILVEASWMWQRIRESIQVQRFLPKNENIVEMVECFETASSVYIVMQFFPSINVTNRCVISNNSNLNFNSNTFNATYGLSTAPSGGGGDGFNINSGTGDMSGSHTSSANFWGASASPNSTANRAKNGGGGGEDMECSDINLSISQSSDDEPQQQQQRKHGYTPGLNGGSTRMSTGNPLSAAAYPPIPISPSMANMKSRLNLNMASNVTPASAPNITNSNSNTSSAASYLTRPMNANEIKSVFIQVVRGVLHLHTHGVVHTGIAPDHVLVNNKGLAKVSNLVSCCFCPRGKKFKNELRGTRHTVAPEVLKKDCSYDPYLADAWSLGILLYFMFNNGKYPHDGANTLKHILYNHIRPLAHPERVPFAALDLLTRLMQVNPQERLTVEGILTHPFCTEALPMEVSGNHNYSNLPNASLVGGPAVQQKQQKQQMVRFQQGGGGGGRNNFNISTNSRFNVSGAFGGPGRNSGGNHNYSDDDDDADTDDLPFSNTVHSTSGSGRRKRPFDIGDGSHTEGIPNSDDDDDDDDDDKESEIHSSANLIDLVVDVPKEPSSTTTTTAAANSNFYNSRQSLFYSSGNSGTADTNYRRFSNLSNNIFSNSVSSASGAGGGGPGKALTHASKTSRFGPGNPSRTLGNSSFNNMSNYSISSSFIGGPGVKGGWDPSMQYYEIDIPVGISKDEEAAYVIQHAYRAYRQRKVHRRVTQELKERAMGILRLNSAGGSPGGDAGTGKGGADDGIAEEKEGKGAVAQKATEGTRDDPPSNRSSTSTSAKAGKEPYKGFNTNEHFDGVREGGRHSGDKRRESPSFYIGRDTTNTNTSGGAAPNGGGLLALPQLGGGLNPTASSYSLNNLANPNNRATHTTANLPGMRGAGGGGGNKSRLGLSTNSLRQSMYGNPSINVGNINSNAERSSVLGGNAASMNIANSNALLLAAANGGAGNFGAASGHYGGGGGNTNNSHLLGGLVCPVCHQLPAATRKITKKPYAATEYEYNNGVFTKKETL